MKHIVIKKERVLPRRHLVVNTTSTKTVRWCLKPKYYAKIYYLPISVLITHSTKLHRI